MREIDSDSRIDAGKLDNATKAAAGCLRSRAGELPHQTRHVHESPGFFGPAVVDSPHAKAFHPHLFARRRHAEKSAAMKPFRDPVINDEVALRYGVQAAHILVEGSSQFLDTVLESLAPGLLPGKGRVIFEILGNHIIERSNRLFSAEKRVDNRDNSLVRGEVAHFRE
jgi:hypothetical protein